MLLSYNRLVDIVDKGYLVGVEPEAINATSIDVRLGNKFLKEIPPAPDSVVDLSRRERINMDSRFGRYCLEPQEFILAHTEEVFNLPNHISAEFSLKSSIARNAMEHLNACWIDAGFHNSVLTLELKNMTRYHRLLLVSGMYIGQIKFFEHEPVPEEQSYATRGRYNNDHTVMGIRR